jgi:hypothetical protein
VEDVPPDEVSTQIAKKQQKDLRFAGSADILGGFQTEDAMRRKRELSTVLFAAALVGLSVVGDLYATTITFEGFPDSTILTTQYPGLTFTNTIILTSGISLNEFEFPPYSGTNVASDNNGPITIDFSPPVTDFSGYFTYIEPLSLDGFNASNMEVASAASEFSDNDALFGDPGSSPNELIELSYAGGMSSVTITGDPLGGSFTMDDITYTTATPEPRMLWLPILGLLAVASRWKRFVAKPTE